MQCIMLRLISDCTSYRSSLHNARVGRSSVSEEGVCIAWLCEIFKAKSTNDLQSGKKFRYMCAAYA